MKKIFTILLALYGLNMMAQVKIGTNPESVNASSLLELESTDKGLLLPRIALTSTAAFAPLAAHVAGMVVYNTATAGVAPNNVTPGQYYNDGTQWIRTKTNTDASDDTNDAFVNDNANTMIKAGTNSDGTTVRAVGTEFVVKDNGNVGMGLTNPSQILDINGKMAVNNVQTIYNAGALDNNFANSLFIGDGGQNLDYTSGSDGQYNTGVGFSALEGITSGYGNDAFGYGSLANLTSGNSNAAFGNNALYNNTTGERNVAVGGSALSGNTTGIDNVAIGFASLSGNSTGSENITLGNYALTGNTTGDDNIAVGYASLSTNTTGGYNVAMGYSALRNNNGSNNVAIGSSALTNVTAGTQNTAIGTSAMSAGNAGNRNVAVGHEAGASSANPGVSTNNIFVGYRSGYQTTTGSNNTLVGTSAGANATTATWNTALGSNALLSTTTGGGNVAVGGSTLRANTIGTFNIALGSSALINNISGNSNFAAGNSALGNNTTGGTNIALGDASLNANSTGGSNIAVGSYALRNNNGNDNVAFGESALMTATAATQNTAIGTGSMRAGNAGNRNVAVGFEAGANVANTGVNSNNVFMGYRTGYAVTSGINNTFIGTSSGLSVTTGSNNTIIGPYSGTAALTNNIVIADGSGNRRINVDATGNTGIGETVPTSTLDVNGSMAVNINAISAATSLNATHCYIIANSGTYAITLPAASTCSGRLYNFKTMGTGTKTISAYLDNTGTSSTALANGSVITLISDGTNWQQFQ